MARPTPAPPADAGASTPEGIVFPAGDDGRRPTMPVNQAIWADAARAAEPALADRIEAIENWRSDYRTPVRALTELGARSGDAATAIARAGLESMRSRLRFGRDGEERPLAEAALDAGASRYATETVEGTAEPVRELVVPYEDDRLSGDALRTQLERWVEKGIIEPSTSDALGAVIDNPEWLAMEGTRVAVLGAGAETSPLDVLSSWGVETVALDLPRPQLWERVLQTARDGAGRVLVPASDAGGSLHERAGANLITDLPEIAGWLTTLAEDKPLVLGFYVYADGALHVQATAAADALAADLQRRDLDVAVAYTGTPSDCYLVPPEVVDDSVVRRDGRGPRLALERSLRRVSGGRLYAPAYPDVARGEDDRRWGVANGLVGKQGPNYALAKRLQRWRSIVTWSEGRPASFNVAPSTWTHSVTKNRLLAAGYYGAKHVGMEVFAPDTMRTVMTALMVHDLHRPWARDAPAAGWHPDERIATGAVHGGYWRRPYDLHSTLVYTGVLGLPEAYRPTLR